MDNMDRHTSILTHVRGQCERSHHPTHLNAHLKSKKKNQKKKNLKGRCHTTRALPSFGMTTQAIRDLFGDQYSNSCTRSM